MSTKNNIKIEHAVLTFRNFGGERKRFNDEGKRNFCVYLDGYNYRGEAFKNEEMIPRYKYGSDWLNPNDLIPALEADGWNVKFTKEGLDESGEVRYPARPYIQVHVKYSELYPRYNPSVYLVKSNGDLTKLGEDSVDQLDRTWIANADLIIKPNNYDERKGNPDGKVSADLQTIYVKPVEDMDEDDFDGKYSRTISDQEDMPW